MIHLDTSFLIDLLREDRRGRPGEALEFIESRLLSGLVTVYPEAAFAPAYARLLAALTRSGRTISIMNCSSRRPRLSPTRLS